MMRRIARITGSRRRVEKFTELLLKTDSHTDHCTAGAKRRQNIVAFF
jgi:hypothetical protein